MKDKEEKKIEKDNGIVYRIGIIGTGRIAARFLTEARDVKAAEVTIVYNPKRESAQKFGQQWHVQSTDSLMLFFQLSDIFGGSFLWENYFILPVETYQIVLCLAESFQQLQSGIFPFVAESNAGVGV